MKKRNLVLVILAILLVFGMVSCGPPPEDDTIPITFGNITTNGNDGTTSTTELYLPLSSTKSTEDDFVSPVLTKNDVEVEGATLVDVDGSSWTSVKVTIKDISTLGTLTVKVSKGGYTFTPASKTVTPKLSTVDKNALTARKTAEDFFGRFYASYYLAANAKPGDTGTNPNTNEFITFSKDSIKFTEEVDSVVKDNLTFIINLYGWEQLSTPPAAIKTGTNIDLDVCFKITGKITSQSGYDGSSKTFPNASTGSTGSSITSSTLANDVKADGTGTEFFIYLYLDEDGDYIARSGFNKGSINSTAGVTGGDNKVRIYEKQ